MKSNWKSLTNDGHGYFGSMRILVISQAGIVHL